jgi:hypothetical protein
VQKKKRQRDKRATATKRVNRVDGWRDGERGARWRVYNIINTVHGNPARRRTRDISHSGAEPTSSDRLTIERCSLVTHTIPGQFSRALCGALHARIRPRPSSLQLPPPVSLVAASACSPPIAYPRYHYVLINPTIDASELHIDSAAGSDRGSPRPATQRSLSPPCTSCCCMAKSRPPAMTRS